MRRELTATELAWSSNLKRIWLKRAKALGLNQSSAAKQLGISRATVCQYLNGHIQLNTDKKLAFAQLLGVDVGEIDPSKVGVSLIPSREVPLVSWLSPIWCGGTMSEEQEREKPIERMIVCPLNHSQEAFAMRVEGDFMVAPHGAVRSYQPGTIIYVDALRKPVNGDRVIASTAHGLTFKTIIFDGAKTYLKPINPAYPTVDVTDEIAVIGVVIGSFIED